MVAGSQRIQQRWAEQNKAGSIQPLISGVVSPLLTTCHICPEVDEIQHFTPPKICEPDTGSFQVWVDGGLVEVKGARKFVRVKATSAIRGRVSGFSSGSRRRLMRFMAKMRTDVLPVFCTLTYPGEFSVDYRRWKNDLHKFYRRFRRAYPGGSFIWRLEPQKRGAPHFHLLIYGVDMTPDFLGWVCESWYRAVGSGDLKHLKWGADVQRIRSQRGVRSYVSKYIAKKQSEPDSTSLEISSAAVAGVDWTEVGRWWGIRSGSNLPLSAVIGASGLDGDDTQRVIRVMRGFLRSRAFGISGVLKSITMFTDAPLQWLDVIVANCGGAFPSTGSFMHLEGYT